MNTGFSACQTCPFDVATVVDECCIDRGGGGGLASPSLQARTATIQLIRPCVHFKPRLLSTLNINEHKCHPGGHAVHTIP